MKYMDFQTNTFLQRAIYGLLSIGFLLRIVVWLQQRSIFLDEANLLRNYAERDYSGLFKDLDYQQYAPPLFSVAMKALIQLFGNHELGVKIVPLFCGSMMLWFFYRLSHRILSPKAVFAAVFFVAFGKIFIDYSTQAKQYATDGFVSMGLLYLSTYFNTFPFHKKQILFWTIIGCVTIWLSMPSVFILTGIGFHFLIKHFDFKNQVAPLSFLKLELLKQNIYNKKIWNILGMISSWLISFLLYFFLLLKNNAQSDYLQSFHQTYFLTLLPTNIVQLKLLITQIVGIFSNMLGCTFVANTLTIIGLSTGIYQLGRTQRDWFLRLVLPIIAVLIASAAHFYSLIPRLTLFFLPLLILIVFIGYDFLFTKINRTVQIIILIAFIATGYEYQNVSYFYKPFVTETAEIKKGLEYLVAEQARGEVFFVPFLAAPVIQYYTEIYAQPMTFSEMILQTRCCDKDMVQEDLKKLHEKGIKKIWIIQDNDYNYLLDFIQQRNGTILKQKKFHRGIILLYQTP
jgi:Dolichyl-phosphate-mannose-protein mannosyltransferase